MTTHKHYIVHAIFAFILCNTGAAIHGSLEYEYDSNKIPTSRPDLLRESSNHVGDSIMRPSEIFGALLGNLVVKAANSKYNYPNSDGHDPDPEFDDGYNDKSELDDHFYDDDPKSEGFFDKRYQSNEYSNDHRYDSRNEKHTYSAERRDSDEKITNSSPELKFDSNENNDRFKINEQSFKNDASVPNLRIDDWPVDADRKHKSGKGIISKTNEGNIRQEDDTSNLSSLYNRHFDSSSEETLKVLTVKKFIFQAQPVKPKNERAKETITLYFLDK